MTVTDTLPAGTVLYTTEEGGAPITRPLPPDGSAPPLVVHEQGQLYQLSLVIHHRHKTPTGGFTHV